MKIRPAIISSIFSERLISHFVLKQTYLQMQSTLEDALYGMKTTNTFDFFLKLDFSFQICYIGTYCQLYQRYRKSWLLKNRSCQDKKINQKLKNNILSSNIEFPVLKSVVF